MSYRTFFGLSGISLILAMATSTASACPQGQKGYHCKHHGHAMHQEHAGKLPGMGYGKKSHGKQCKEHRNKQALMQKKLGLSEEQIARMRALKQEKRSIMQSLHQQMQDLKHKLRSLDPKSPGYKEQIFALAEQKGILAQRMVVEKGEMRFKMASVLSDEQYALKQQMKQQRQHYRGHGKQCKHGKGHGHGHGKQGMKSAPQAQPDSTTTLPEKTNGNPASGSNAPDKSPEKAGEDQTGADQQQNRPEAKPAKAI